MPSKLTKNNLLFICLLMTFYFFNNALAQTEVKREAQPTEKTIGLRYQSAFEAYQRYLSPTISSWKQVNDTVKEIGGWRTYAKEAAEEKKEKPLETHQSNGER